MVVAQHKVVLVNEYVAKTSGKQKLDSLSSSTKSYKQQLSSTQKSLLKLREGMNYYNQIHQKTGMLTTQQSNSLKKITKSYKRLGGSMDQVQGHSQSLLTSFTKFRWALVNVALAAGLAYGAFQTLIKPSIEFESALAEIQKTTGFTDTEMKGMGESIKDLSTILPTTAMELAEIAAVAGQLGIGTRAGVDGINSFTAAIATIAEATDLTAEEAATNMAKISQAFNMPISQTVFMGSAMNELENTTAAKTSEIASSLTRVGTAATTLGISFETTTAAVTTMISAGMRAERAGTRLRSLFNSMSKNAEEFSKIAGTTLPEFRRLLETNADEALRRVVEGLENTDLKSQQMQDALSAAGKVGGFALLTLAGNAEAFSTNLETAQGNMDDFNSLLDDMQTKTETVAGQWEILTNKIKSTLLMDTGTLSDLVAGLRTISEVGLFDREREGALPTESLLGPLAPFAGLLGANERLKDLIEEEKQLLRDQAQQAGMTGQEIEKMFSNIEEPGRKLIFILDDIRQRTALLKSTKIEEGDVTPEVKSIDEIEQALKDYEDQLNETSGSTKSLSDFTWEYRLRIKELQRELRDVSEDLSNTRKAIAGTNEEISNILSRRFNISGISETDIGFMISQQEMELKKAQFAALGLGSAEEFLRNAAIMTSDAIDEQTQSIENLNNVTATAQERYDAWRETLNETIRSLLINSQDIDKDVTEVVKKAQSELIAINRMDTGGASGEDNRFNAMEDNLSNLRLAQDIFFGEERNKLRHSEQLREDRINGMNKNADTAISLLEMERESLARLTEEERMLIENQEKIRDEMEENRVIIDDITEAWNLASQGVQEYIDKLEKMTGYKMPGGGGEVSSAGGRTTSDSYWSRLGSAAEGGGTAGDIIRSVRGSYGDFISRPGQPMQAFSPTDTVIGVKNPEKLSNNTNMGPISINIQGYQRDKNELAAEIRRELTSIM